MLNDGLKAKQREEEELARQKSGFVLKAPCAKCPEPKKDKIRSSNAD